ncbi:MAG: hypothetical protein ACI4MH_06700 [Candidatus Coproplasma sp.]
MKGRVFKFCTGLIISLAIIIGVIWVERRFLSLSAGAGGVSTCSGYVSQNVYASRLEAAKGLLSEELSGGSQSPVYDGFIYNGDLSEEEITQLGVRAMVSETVQAVTSVTVRYSFPDENGEVGAYILKLDGGTYRYYSALPAVGERLTNSYYASVTDSGNYTNFTATTSCSVRALDGLNECAYSCRQIIKIDGDRASIAQDMYVNVVDICAVEGSGGLYFYSESGTDKGKYESISSGDTALSECNTVLRLLFGDCGVDVSGMKSAEEIARIPFCTGADPASFKKTEDGFSAQSTDGKDIYESYKKTYGSLAGSSVLNGVFEQLDYSFGANVVSVSRDYYVGDGKVTAYRMVFTVGNARGDVLFSVNLTTSFSGFGNTKVEFSTTDEGGL